MEKNIVCTKNFADSRIKENRQSWHKIRTEYDHPALMNLFHMLFLFLWNSSTKIQIHDARNKSVDNSKSLPSHINGVCSSIHAVKNHLLTTSKSDQCKNNKCSCFCFLTEEIRDVYRYGGWNLFSVAINLDQRIREGKRRRKWWKYLESTFMALGVVNIVRT